MTNEEIQILNTDTPQFPGQQLAPIGIEKIRAWIKKQKRVKGYSFTVPVGSSQFNLDLSGNARIFLGLALFGKPVLASYPNWNNFFNVNSMALTINNEIILDQLDPNFLTQQFNNQEYYYLPRPLSGTDQITMAFQNNGAATEIVNVAVYYI